MNFQIKSSTFGCVLDTWSIDTQDPFTEDWVRNQAVANIACSLYSIHYGEPPESAEDALEMVGEPEININHFSEPLMAAGGTAFCGGDNFDWEFFL